MAGRTDRPRAAGRAGCRHRRASYSPVTFALGWRRWLRDLQPVPVCPSPLSPDGPMPASIAIGRMSRHSSCPAHEREHVRGFTSTSDNRSGDNRSATTVRPPSPAARTLRDVVFVEGVRTPFGKAGDKGQYAQTRADDMVVKVIRELLRRQPGLPPGADRRGGHRRRHPDRRPGPDDRPQRRHPGRAPPLGARLRHRPDVRRRDDRGHHGRLRHRGRRLRRRHRRRCRAHGPPPDGRGRRSQPTVRLRPTGRPVRPDDGLHRREPARPVPAPDQGARRRIRTGQPGEVRQGAGQRQDRPGSRAGGHPLRRAGLGTGRSGRNAPPRNDSRRPRAPCARRSGRTAG